MRGVKTLFALLFLAAPLLALPHDPAVSRTHVAFIEAGQLWLVPRGGGAAVRVTNTPGEKSSARFSPDGATLAYTSGSIYTVPVRGGVPTRVTFLPSEQLLCQWTADDRLLFSTNALSFSHIEMQLFTVSPRGELPRPLPLAFGADGALDASGTWLAYTPRWSHQLIANWKGYRGGAAPDLWLFNLQTRESRRITEWAGSDVRPMWHGATLYYVSDEGAEGRRNVWAYDTRTHARRQVTHFTEYDVRDASIGPDAIVFALGPELRLLELRGERSSVVRATILATPLVRDVDASRFVTFRQAANGVVLLEGRGDLWIARANAAPRNLTATSGAFEREASLRPDGRAVAYWSDATGEYQLYVRDLERDAAPQPLTSFTSGFRYRPVWSRDGKRLAFTDETGAIVIFDVDTRRTTSVDRETWSAGVEPTELAWSPDGAWLAYTKTAPNRLTQLWRYDLATNASQPLTADAFNASTPVFDATGEHLFFLSYRNFSNIASDWIQSRIINRGLATIVDVPLRGAALDMPSVERRALRLPTTAGSIVALSVTADGNPLYALVDLAGKRSVRSYDLRARKENVVADDSTDLDTVSQPHVDTASMTMHVDLAAEWRELFRDAWRAYRDFFYAPKQPLAHWDAVATRYEPMLARCRNREEVNLVLAAMIGESSVGHAYIASGGDIGPRPPDDAATLGADFTVERGAFRITRIVEGAPFDDAARSPLHDAREGEYVLAVDGKPLDVARDLHAALVGRANQSVQLTVGPNPAVDASSRVLTVTPLASENELRRRAWIEANRRHVSDASGGRIGYVHIPDFTNAGYGDLARQFYAQLDKDALIIDARWSLGGSTGAAVAELLARRDLNFAAGRYNQPWPSPRFGVHAGAKALLVNHITVSAGENFSYYFRKLGIGPIVGSRTWGGLTGLNGAPALIDGGAVNVPNAPFYDESGWLLEGHGLEPDVAVERDPASDADAQLDAAIRTLQSTRTSSSTPTPPR